MKLRKKMLSVLLAAALLLTAVLPVGAVTQDDIQAIKNQLNSVTARKEEAEAQLAAIRGDLSRAQEQVELVQEQVLLTEQQVSAGREMLARYDAQIEEKQKEIAGLEAKEARRWRNFINRCAGWRRRGIRLFCPSCSRPRASRICWSMPCW